VSGPEAGPGAGPGAGGAAGSAAAVAERLAEAAGPFMRGAVHFGSTLTGSSPDRQSAHDLFVIVSDARGFFERTRPVLPAPRSPATLTWLNRRIPPDILHFPGGPDDPGAKIFVIGEHDFDRALSGRARDHFVRGRLMQRVARVYARDEAAAAWLDECLERNRRLVVRWLRPWLPDPFGVEDFTRRMLDISYGGEVRPESSGRVDEVFQVQRDFLLDTYAAVLAAAADAGDLVREGPHFGYDPRPTAADRRRSRRWFARSKVRATLRWSKYMLTFDGWLDYLASKVERRTGVAVELTDRRRRWPLVFLWPEFFRVLRARGRRADGPAGRKGNP